MSTLVALYTFNWAHLLLCIHLIEHTCCQENESINTSLKGWLTRWSPLQSIALRVRLIYNLFQVIILYLKVVVSSWWFPIIGTRCLCMTYNNEYWKVTNNYGKKCIFTINVKKIIFVKIENILPTSILYQSSVILSLGDRSGEISPGQVTKRDLAIGVAIILHSFPILLAC